jgi:uncharacterized protein (TIGR02145 family)
MKRTIAFIAFIALCQTLAFGQKKYEMVVETTDGNSITSPTEDIKRVYFRVSSVNYIACPDNNHPHLIDLGLPSGTKWACCNVGASKPEDYGNYYAWGETQTKDEYNRITYIHYDGSSSTFQDIGSDIAGTQYDAATSNWGASWRLPSRQQCKELIDNCTSEQTTQNGIDGRTFTGPNGGTIFLPAGGHRWNNGVNDARSYGYYWSSTLYESFINYAWYLVFNTGGVLTDRYDSRADGFSVRPVQ